MAMPLSLWRKLELASVLLQAMPTCRSRRR